MYVCHKYLSPLPKCGCKSGLVEFNLEFPVRKNFSQIDLSKDHMNVKRDLFSCNSNMKTCHLFASDKFLGSDLE